MPIHSRRPLRQVPQRAKRRKRKRKGGGDGSGWFVGLLEILGTVWSVITCS